MTTGTMLTIFEDFNELKDEQLPLSNEEIGKIDHEADQIRQVAWTDGYLAARRDNGAQNSAQSGIANLLTSLHEIDTTAASVVEEAAMSLAELLVNTVIAVTTKQWSARLLERVRLIAEQIRPALAVTPEFTMRHVTGTVRRFGDISELSRALDDSDIEQDVSIRWHFGQATISHRQMLEDLREAIIPLSAGFISTATATDLSPSDLPV